jgi:NADPH2:quinone reductase
MITNGIRVHKQGGPEEMKWQEIALPEIKKDEVLIKHTAIGLNYIDTYHRSGLYPMPVPLTLGIEGAGIVEEVGENVNDLKTGDRVAYASPPTGSYAEAKVMPADRLVKIPDNISDEIAAAIMLKGMTVEYLFNRTTPIRTGDTILFHAAAGGVGLIACQWAKSENITLIGTAGSDEKCKLALKYGATHCINYNKENFEEKVKEITAGAGVDVVMDSVGQSTFEGSLNCLKPLGMMITFGNASGPIPPFNLGQLGAKGSLKITRPTLFTHIGNHNTCQEMAKNCWPMIMSICPDITFANKFFAISWHVL